MLPPPHPPQDSDGDKSEDNLVVDVSNEVSSEQLLVLLTGTDLRSDLGGGVRLHLLSWFPTLPERPDVCKKGIKVDKMSPGRWLRGRSGGQLMSLMEGPAGTWSRWAPGEAAGQRTSPPSAPLV